MTTRKGFLGALLTAPAAIAATMRAEPVVDALPTPSNDTLPSAYPPWEYIGSCSTQAITGSGRRFRAIKVSDW